MVNQDSFHSKHCNPFAYCSYQIKGICLDELVFSSRIIQLYHYTSVLYYIFLQKKKPHKTIWAQGEVPLQFHYSEFPRLCDAKGEWLLLELTKGSLNALVLEQVLLREQCPLVLLRKSYRGLAQNRQIVHLNKAGCKFSQEIQ